MGYIHNWFIKKEILDVKKWNNVINDLEKLKMLLPKHSKSSGAYYALEPLIIKGVVLNENEIKFNGGNKIENGGNKIEDLAHEDFHVSRINKTIKNRNGFCKTNRKPYDLYVQVVLIILRHHFEDDFIFRSDGDFEEWSEAFNFVRKHIDLKYKDSYYLFLINILWSEYL